jgi:6-phosphogluconolactonase
VTPRIQILADLEAVSREAARRLVDAARGAIERRGVCTIALAGGATPRRLYRLLASDEYRPVLPWDVIAWFWSDERCVPPDDPESNYRIAYDTLLGPAGVPPERVHRIGGEIRPPARAASDYEATLRGAIADGALDLVLLGAGADGHTASLFPGSPALAERERWVVATEAPGTAGIRERVTMTYPLLDRARDVLVLAAGESKRDVVTTMMRDPSGAALRYPVARLNPAGRLTWLVDHPATY